jgi:hypothetical protein
MKIQHSEPQREVNSGNLVTTIAIDRDKLPLGKDLAMIF